MSDNGNNGNNDDRSKPPHGVLPFDLVPNNYIRGAFKQAPHDRPPVRAIKYKANELRQNLYRAKEINWSDIYSRYIDLWQEARMCIWRAKRSKPAVMTTRDPVDKKDVLHFTADEKTIIEAINCVKGVLDSMVRLRRELNDEGGTAIPRWAIQRIEEALRGHPDALDAILEGLAKGEDR